MPVIYELVDRVLFGQHRLAIPLQTAVQYLIGGPRPSEFILNQGPTKGLKFACMTSEKYFFERDKFELPVRHLFEKLVKPGWIVYEIGGHIGYWALVLSRLVGARGHVYVFEPSPVNFPRLLRNIEANNLHNITAHNLAVSEKNGPIGFSENGSMSRVGGSPLNPVVQSVRLDDFMRAAPPPQLMLVDAEGHGSQIFRGADELLRTVRPHLVYETHDQGEQRETDEILSKHGYRFDWIDRKDGFPARINATYGSLT